MKERRRKKRLAELGQLEPTTTTSLSPSNNTSNSHEQNTPTAAAAAAANSKKRPRPAEDTAPSPSAPQEDLVVVSVPAGLSLKDARKFRKDARRQARSQGRDDSQIQFVVEGEELPPPPQPKKSKLKFACIKELVQEEKLLQEKLSKQQKEDNLSEEHKAQFVALDCEMVGIGTDGKQSALARVSMVDWWGKTLIDTFVQVPTKVTDFRTFVSGVQPKHIQSSKAMDVKECRETVAKLLKDKILVGHALKNDLHALLLQHPRDKIRDTAHYRPFQRFHKKWRPRKLRDLALEHCGLTIQVAGQSHNSVEDASAAMELYKMVQTEWEKELELKATKLKKNSHR